MGNKQEQIINLLKRNGPMAITEIMAETLFDLETFNNVIKELLNKELIKVDLTKWKEFGGIVSLNYWKNK